jgi:hypothetical protein
VAVRDKGESFALWLQRKDHESREEYEKKGRDVKRIIVECKKRNE